MSTCSQQEVAKMLGISQSRVSSLTLEKIDMFSVESLLFFIEKLGYSVEFNLTKK